MRLSDIKGDRTLDVIADIIDPIANIAEDSAAAALFHREKLPEGETPKGFMLQRVRKHLPQLLKGHKGDIIAILAAIESAGKKCVAGEFDMPSTAAQTLEKGTLGCTAEGMMCDIVYVFAIMANYLMGTPLSSEPVCIDTGYIFVTSADEQAKYYQYVESDGVYAYTADEFKQMLRAYNPEFTAEDLQALASAWSLQDVIDRHSN